MSVQVFQGSTTASAMSRVRKSLGEEAIIVDVRGGSFGPIEVLATAPPAELPLHLLRAISQPDALTSGSHRAVDSAGPSSLGSRHKSSQVSRPRGRRLSDAETSTDLPVASGDVGPSTARSARLSIVRQTPPAVDAVHPPPHARASNPPRIFESPTLHELRDLDLPADVCQRLAGAAGVHPEPWERILAWVDSVWPVRLPEARAEGGPMVVGFFGPRCVGRSTLARGLAARAAIAGDGGVCWLQVGFPGRRVPDPDDLRSPLGVDLRVAHYVGELQEIAHDHRQSDVVLVDLPGIDPWDEAERAGLAHFIQGVRHVMPAVRWHAVLPATWGVRHAALTLEALSELRPEAIAWTHLDEAVDASSILATAVRSHLGPSFLHGDRAGNGATSRAADWQALIDTLRPRRAQATAN